MERIWLIEKLCKIWIGKISKKRWQILNYYHELQAWTLFKISCDVGCVIYLCFNEFNCTRLQFYSKLISILMLFHDLHVYMQKNYKFSKFIYKLMWLQWISLKNSWSLNNFPWWNGDIYHVLLLEEKLQTINGL